MPTYFNRPSVNNILTPNGFQYKTGETVDIINTKLDNTTTIVGGTNSNCCCPSTTKFFETLVNKLEEMTFALKAQFTELESNQYQPQLQQKVFVIAEAPLTGQLVSIHTEYLTYVNRYGPPQNGIFDETLLIGLRKELGL